MVLLIRRDRGLHSNPPSPPILAMALDAHEVARRRSHIVDVGLPCDVVGVVVDGDFSSLVLVPAEGWTHLVADEELAGFEARGERYHVSLGYWVDAELLADIHARWAGVRTVVAIDWVRESNVAMLRWGDGLGGDPAVWAALAQGYPRRSFGLHVSM